MQQNIVGQKEGRRMASVTTVRGAGHLVVQEKPRGLALAIWNILLRDYGRPKSNL